MMKYFKLIVSFLFLSLCLHTGFAQISPGELSKAHANLEGISNCTKCHTVGSKVSQDKCLACHKEIKESMVAKKGFHSSQEVMSKNCVVCHNEHHGRNFQIVKIDKKNFDHSKTGFELKGVHAKKDCRACHNPGNIVDPRFKKSKTTYMGLSGECLSCHADFHQGKLPANCASCHSFDSFKTNKVVGFDHNKTKFKLLGKHENLKCSKCHKTEIIDGEPAQKFKGMEFANCTPCHKDVHETRFGNDCKQCHTEESFKEIKNLKVNFNHDKTAFKLIGKHATLECKACHKTSKMTDPIAHNRCADCHKDYHKGEFVKNGVAPDCNECHTNNSFAQTNFTIERHNKLKFKLEGAHMATPCMDCHRKQKEWKFTKMDTKCVACHKNEHKGLMSDKFMPNENCLACHNVLSWKKVSFDHNKTQFKLEGAHAKTACVQCHYAKNSKGQKVQKFKGLSAECSACHKDNHVGQFAENGVTNCVKCHTVTRWEDSKFDHNTARFKLDGKHVNVKCVECHKPITEERGKFIQYKFKSFECIVCHS